MLEEAIKFAIKAHKGQIRKISKLPFVIHPIRVMINIPDKNEKIIAILHDVMEDTNITLDDLKIFGSYVTKHVDILTKKRSDSYIDYIKKIKNNEVAKKIKIYDIIDNINDYPSEKSIIKYTKALDYLIN